MLGNLAYFHSLQDFGYCRCFKVEKVRHVISTMSRERVIKSTTILIEF